MEGRRGPSRWLRRPRVLFFAQVSGILTTQRRVHGRERKDDCGSPVRPRGGGPGRGEDDVAAVKALNLAYTKMTDQLARVIVGQKQVIEQVLVAMFCQRPLPAGGRARAWPRRCWSARSAACCTCRSSASSSRPT